MGVVQRLDGMTNPSNRGSTVNGPGPWRTDDTSVVVTANGASAANPARHALARPAGQPKRWRLDRSITAGIPRRALAERISVTSHILAGQDTHGSAC